MSKISLHNGLETTGLRDYNAFARHKPSKSHVTKSKENEA